MSLNENGRDFVNYFENMVKSPTSVIVERIAPEKVGGDWEPGFRIDSCLRQGACNEALKKELGISNELPVDSFEAFPGITLEDIDTELGGKNIIAVGGNVANRVSTAAHFSREYLKKWGHNRDLDELTLGDLEQNTSMPLIHTVPPGFTLDDMQIREEQLNVPLGIRTYKGGWVNWTAYQPQKGLTHFAWDDNGVANENDSQIIGLPDANGNVRNSDNAYLIHSIMPNGEEGYSLCGGGRYGSLAIQAILTGATNIGNVEVLGRENTVNCIGDILQENGGLEQTYVALVSVGYGKTGDDKMTMTVRPNSLFTQQQIKDGVDYKPKPVESL